jgi:hypothetical protein
MELQNDEEWVVWCKANPKEKATQTFREYGKCIFEGKLAKVTQANDNHEGSLGGKHVTRT